ncbi:MAG: polyketide cyclase [Sphingobacteriales bacterium]|nr:MAG: polyketide cyclase [Sphingobacteriales bacterium]
MKILKWAGILLLGIIALALIVAAFVPKTFTYERNIVISKPRAVVFDYIKYIKHQDNYGKWQLMDPGMKKMYEGTDGTVGFKYSWDSKELGKGSQTITKIVEGASIATSLDFGFGEPADSYMTTADEGAGQTKVTWGISGRSPYPFNLMSLFYDMGKDFETGLNNLKNVLEK